MNERIQLDFDIIIVGAGLAGLSAARELAKNDPSVKFIVLEAKNRVGGRTHTVEMQTPNGGTTLMDIGGQWVGSTQHHIMQLIEELGLKTYEQYEQGTKYAQLGTSTLRKYEGDIFTCLQQFTQLEIADWSNSWSKLEQLTQEVDHKNPFQSKNAAIYDQMSLEKWCLENCKTKTVHDLIDETAKTVYGVGADKVNLLYHLIFSKSAGSFITLLSNIEEGSQAFKVENGTQQISEAVANELGIQNIRLNTAVHKIEYSERLRQNTVHFYGTNSDHMELEGLFNCKKVILAIPPNQCKEILFCPALPEKKKRLFETCLVGHYIKFLMTFQTSFWRKDGYSGEVISIGKSGEQIWPILEVYDACTPNGVPALIGFISENFGQLAKEERKVAVLKDLERYFGPCVKSQLVDYNEKLWVNEPFNGGCPTLTISPGNMDTWTTIRDSHGSIYFAGTETAFEWMGYMSGAVESGIRVAKEVLNSMREEK